MYPRVPLLHTVVSRFELNFSLVNPYWSSRSQSWSFGPRLYVRFNWTSLRVSTHVVWVSKSSIFYFCAPDLTSFDGPHSIPSYVVLFLFVCSCLSLVLWVLRKTLWRPGKPGPFIVSPLPLGSDFLTSRWLIHGKERASVLGLWIRPESLFCHLTRLQPSHVTSVLVSSNSCRASSFSRGTFCLDPDFSSWVHCVPVLELHSVHNPKLSTPIRNSTSEECKGKEGELIRRRVRPRHTTSGSANTTSAFGSSS